MLKSYFDANKTEAGCDEVGRGCLAGPVVAAAVILPKHFKHNLLNDSKKICRSKRELLKTEIENVALAYGIGEVSPKEIDEINILYASFLAMQRAIDKLKIEPELLLIDGNKYTPHNSVPYQCIVKGDSKFLSIAAASVLAKIHRDQLMRDLDKKYPHYGWDTNMGYPTIAHRQGIQRQGITPYHRKTFQLLPK